MVDSFADARRSLRRDDPRWYYACKLRSLAWLTIEWLSHAEFHTTSLRAAAMAEQQLSGTTATAEARR